MLFKPVYRQLPRVLLIAALLAITSACFNNSHSLGNNKRADRQTIHLSISSYLGDQQVFVKHDILAFLLSLDSSAYIYVIYEDAAGRLVQVVPNRQQPDSYYIAGDFISIPPEDARYQLQVSPPFGSETLWVFASDTRPDENAWAGLTRPSQLDNGLLLLDTSLDAIQGFLRKQSRSAFGYASTTLVTQENPHSQ